VFCASLADVFDNQVDPNWRADLFALIRECDQLDWQLLTKRPQNIRKMLPKDWDAGYANVWLGTTAEDARAYRQRAAHLLGLPARVHFISYEPALGPIGDLEIAGRAPDWVIIGGESGVRADRIRRMNPKWARDAIAECRRVGAAPFLKQWGSYANNPLVVEQGLSTEDAKRLDQPSNGKGGGMLDGRLWREFPVDVSLVNSTGRRAKNAVERRTVPAW
jgi:protein gp37